MAPGRLLYELPAAVAPAVRRGSTAAYALSSVDHALAGAERRESRIQVTRIAELEAQLDLLLVALRRSPDRTHTR